MKVNDFEEDLSWADNLKQWSKYLPALVKFYPDVENWQRTLEISDQKAGVDLKVEQNGQVLNVQLKARRKDWGDMLIEYRHDYLSSNRVDPGWIEIYKPGNPHDIVYFAGKTARKIDFSTLHTAWERNKDTWIDKYDLPPAYNETYDTRNVAIPWSVLENAGVKIEMWSN